MRSPAIATWSRAAAVLCLAGAAWANEAPWQATVVRPVKDAGTHEMLRAAAADPDPALRAEALRAFRAIRDPADAPRVEAALADPEPAVRACAVLAAGALGQALPRPLADALANDPDERVRRTFFETLPALDAGGRAALCAAGLGDASPSVRAAAAGSAAACGVEPGALLDRLSGEPDAGTQCALLHALAGRGAGVRAAALRGVFERGAPAAVTAALTLVGSGDGAFEPEVLRGLREPAVARVEAAVGAAARLRSRAAAPDLRRCLREGVPVVRRAACAALAGQGEPATVAALGERLLGDPDLLVCRAAARALAATAGEAAGDALRAGLAGARPRVRSETAAALAERGDPRAAPALLPLLDDPDTGVQTAVLEALHVLDPAAAAPRSDRVRELVRHETPAAACAAIALLTDLGDRSEIPYYVQRLTQITWDAPWEVREAAMRALTRLGHAGFEQRALEVATLAVVPPPPMSPEPSTDTPAVRIAALEYLAAFGKPGQDEGLIGGFEDLPPPPIRPALAAALSKLTGRRYRPVPDTGFVSYRVETLARQPYALSPPSPCVEEVR